jgi:prophage antirepressor-like protein
MLARKMTSRNGVQHLLNDPRVRRAPFEGKTVFAAADVAGVLAESDHAAELWEDLKARELVLAQHVVETAEFEAIDMAGVFRLVQSFDTPRAERIKAWLAQTAVERIEEQDDPELALLRTRHAYEAQGYSRQWIDQRMRSVSGRQELTSEWYRRGVRESDEFRALTNEMMQAAFGMDVETYRRYKGLFRTGANLRDHMTELELALTALSESTAVELARQRRSSGFDALLLDAKETGQIIAKTRSEIEERTGRRVVSAVNHLPRGGPRPPRRPGAQGRVTAADTRAADGVAQKREIAA